MKSKIILGMSLASVAFWACSSEDKIIEPLGPNSEQVSSSSEDTPLDDEPVLESSSAGTLYLTSSNSSHPPKDEDSSSSEMREEVSSSSVEQGNLFCIEDCSSSSEKQDEASSSSLEQGEQFHIVDRSSSSEAAPKELSSSSGIAPIIDGTFGTCAPLKNPINKGESVQWRFTANSKYPGFDPLKVAKATYDWSFAAGAVDDGSGKGTTSGNVAYPAAGQTTASVTVLYDGTPIIVTCDPLQVNGAAITSCKCEPDVANPDIANGPVTVTWSVSNCSSAGATITGYEWTGATGTGESASATVTKKDENIAPVVSVSNEDNTVQNFTCSSIRTVDSNAPDYIITSPVESVELPKGTSSLTVLGGENISDCTFSCNSDGNGEMSIEFGTGDKLTGSFFASGSVSLEICQGTTAITLSTAASCSARWY